MTRFLFLLCLASSTAMAFPWMVKHDYASCASCHVDPSGGGQLSKYGRAQADVLVRWKLTKPVSRKEEEVPASANFLWFLELPDALNLSGNLRSGALIRPAAATPVIPMFMAYDLYATVNVLNFVGHATAGVGIRNAQLAAIAPQCDASAGPCGVQAVAREYWGGAKFAEESVMVRAGRMNIPFGLRNSEHTTFVRSLTRTDINVAQQVGVAASYNGEGLRGEVMGVLGNFQIGPDVYRERGYAAYGEYGLSSSLFVGLSSQILRSQGDYELLRPTTRHAHGLFARWAPSQALAILAEGDLLAWQSPSQLDRIGFAGLVQGDYELMQGIHLIGTLEAAHTGTDARGFSYGGWISAAWNVLPHIEIRIDNMVRRLAQPELDAALSYSLLVQLHVFL